ncbi:hypothetical protein [Thermoleptolyngbya sp.]
MLRNWVGLTTFDLGPKLKEQENGRLVLQCPLQWERVFGACLLAFAVLGLGFGGSSRLTCDRPTLSTTHCQVTRFFGPGLFPLRAIELGSLTSVQVVHETRSSEDGDDYLTYDVHLTGTKTNVRLGLHDNRDSVSAIQISDSVQRFLVNPAQTDFVVNTPTDWSGTWISTGCLMTAIALLRRKAFRFEFDRLMGTLQIFGANGQVKQQLFLREVQSIAIEQSSVENDTGYRVVLVMQSGDRHPLTHTYSTTLVSKQAAAEAIREFLRLPPVEMG